MLQSEGGAMWLTKEAERNKICRRMLEKIQELLPIGPVVVIPVGQLALANGKAALNKFIYCSLSKTS